MNSTTRYYEMFNTTIDNLITDLIKTFPNDTSFKLFKATLKIIKVTSVKKPLELFNIALTDEYKQNIRDKNEVFFLENDYSEVLNNPELNKEKNNDKNNISDQLINKLKNNWKDLNEDNRKIVWEYFNVLLKLCEKVENN